MTVDHTLERAEWIRMHLRQIPDLIMHIRDQRFPSLQAGQGSKITGGGDRARAPMQLDPIDDADELWAVMCALADELAERTGRPAPVKRSSVWVRRAAGVRQVYGLGTADPEVIYQAVERLMWWLKAHALTLTIEVYQVPVDELIDKMRTLRGKYPEAPAPFRARMRCPICGMHSVERRYSPAGEIEGLWCTACGASRTF